MVNQNNDVQTNNATEIKARTLPDGKGGRVPVSEELYHAYWDPERAERKRRERAFRCRDGKGVRCKKDCTLCSYYRNGGQPIGNAVSLDALYEENEYEVPGSSNVEEAVMYALLLEELNKALEELDPEGRRIAELIKSGTSDRNAAAAMNLKRSTYSDRKLKLLSRLRERLTDFR